MNEIERAIKDFEDFKQAGYSHSELPSSWNIELAIAALREQAERESGCEWCKTPSHNPDIGGCTLVFYRSKAHPIGAYAISVSVFDEYGEEQEPVLVRIDNCIHCGKRLEAEHEDD